MGIERLLDPEGNINQKNQINVNIYFYNVLIMLIFKNYILYFMTDVNTSVPDKKSIMMYVMCLFQSLPHSGDDIGELDLSVASDSSPVTTPGAEVP